MGKTLLEKNFSVKETYLRRKNKIISIMYILKGKKDGVLIKVGVTTLRTNENIEYT